MFLPLGYNKSLSTCRYFVTALTFRYPVKNFHILCREDYPVCVTSKIFISSVTVVFYYF